MRFTLRVVSLFVLLSGLLALTAGTAEAVVVLFKDGFVLQGRITVPKEYFVDKVSHQAFSVPVAGAVYSIEDGVRKIIFDPNQVHDVLKDKTPDLMSITLPAPTRRGNPLPQQWDVGEVGDWDEHWQRPVKVNVVIPSTGPGVLNLRQRLTLLTPTIARVDALDNVDWVAYYRTTELGPAAVRTLLHHYYTKKEEPELDRRLHMARFMLQAGWTDYARRELDDVLKNFPGEKSRAQDLVDSLKKTESAAFLDALENASRGGRVEELANRLAGFANDKALAESLNEKEVLLVQETKSKLDATQQQLAQARHYLTHLPAHIALVQRDQYAQAAELILKELTPDTLPRLETFLALAPAQLDPKRRPNQPADTVMAFALSGWVLGSGAAEGNVQTAWQLWQARQMLMEYQKTTSGLVRARVVSNLKGLELAPDVVARIIRLLPPPDPCDKLNANVIELQSEAPDQARAVSYLVQLPPEYNHQRAHPVLIVLHRSEERAGDMLNRWSELAAKNGYLLVAPSWGGGSYNYTDKEQAAVLDTLRDLRRRFQVDSDRVFLFGAEEGGTMAYDVGLGHPDLFAGVLVMSSHPNYFSYKYRTNAQYLPFYVVDGERHAKSPLANRAVFKDWVRWHYPVLYVEYRGRTNDWFEAEPANMIDWMNRKKRHQITRQLGQERGGEFYTMRQSDNHFYWLSTNAISPRRINDVRGWSDNVHPAKLQCTIYTGNQIHLHVEGVEQVSVWLAPGLIDFGKNITVKLNGTPVVGVPRTVQPNLETLLEEFYYNGDRQRLFLAKLDLNLKGG